MSLRDAAEEREAHGIGPSSTRKRVRKTETWKRNISKKLRNTSKQYTSLITGKEVAEKKVGEPCTDGCFATVGRAQINTLFTRFWALVIIMNRTHTYAHAWLRKEWVGAGRK